MNRISELKLDVSELEQLASQAKRQKVKDALTLEIRRINTEISKLQETESEKSEAATNGIVTGNKVKRYEVKLKDYAWDQTDKFMKFYVSLKDVHKINPEHVVCQFNPKSLELLVLDLNNKDYSFTIKRLLYPLKPEDCSWKIKTDMVLIFAAKSTQQNWSHVTEIEKAAAESQKLVPDRPSAGGDPTDGLMSMMKSMYEKGDDEMKRTIAKAWTESQQQKAGGGSMF